MFNGEIVFDIADEEHVEVDLGAEIIGGCIRFHIAMKRNI